MIFKRLFFVLFVLCCFTSLQCQRQTSTPSVSTINRPGSIQDTGLYNYWNQMTTQGRSGGALLGKMKVEGEPLPWEPLLVTVSCNGKVAHTTESNANGNFGIVAFTLPGALGKQGDSQRQMESYLEGCVVQGVVSGFHSTSITLTRRMLRDDPDIGTITLSRIGTESSPTISSTTATASPKAIKFFEKAHNDMIEQNADGAMRDLKKAVETDPNFAEGWLQLGKLQAASDPQAARESFSKALAADPKFVLPYEQLAALAATSGSWQDVLDNTNKLWQEYPRGTPRSWYLTALAYYQLGRRDLAEANARNSLAIDPNHTVGNTEQLLAVLLAAKGNYKGALDHLRNSLTYVPPGPDADMLKQQIAQLEQRSAAKPASK